MTDGKMDSQEFAVWSSLFRAALNGRVAARDAGDLDVEDAEHIADLAFKIWDKRRKANGL